ncbi:MAG: hypothetical protein SGPRY_002218, partial [Prymnesium sp.]
MWIRFKASVHSGTLVDMLNDCRTAAFCLWFEEQTWHSKELGGSDINSIDKRLQRAAKCLVVKKQCDASGRSAAGYCISLDRDHGHIAAKQRLWREDGIHSSAMMDTNRVGLPRETIRQVAADLADCETHACQHHPDSAG